MGASASLSQGALTVDPGGEASCEVKVRNTGSVVDQFSLDVIGDAGPWSIVEPASLNLFPGAEGTARVVFKPPKSSKIAAGDVAFGVRIVSKEDIEGSVVEEGTLAVGGFEETTAELLPRTSRGRRKARHELAVDNRGNHRVNADIMFNDPDQLLKFTADPPSLVTEPGTATFAKVDVKPKDRFLRGTSKTHPFQVIVAPEKGEPVVTDGTMVQEPILPGWLIPALLLAVALLIVLFVLWQTLFKSVIESAARDKVGEDLAAVEETAQEANENAAAAAGAAEEAAQDASAAAGAAGTAADAVEEITGDGAGEGAVTSTPFDDRLAATDAVGGPVGTDEFAVPENQTLVLTDVVFQNPQGDAGVIRLRRGPGGPILFEIGLQNFRDLDYHFVSPLRFPTGQNPVLEVQCTAVGSSAPDPALCSAAAYIGGSLETVAEEA